MQSKKYIIPKVSDDPWILCKERCANAIPTGGCKRGTLTPPDHWVVPVCPEKCSGFKAQERGAGA